MRNLKKLLAVVVAICVLATFTVPAFAADTTTAAATVKTDAQIATDLGVIKGSGGGVTADYLATTPDRLQGAIMFLRLKGLEDTAKAFIGTDNFADVEGLNDTNQAILAYLKANPDLGFAGTGSNKFEATLKMTAKEYYKVMLVALGFTYGTDATADFTWANVFGFAASKGLTKNIDNETFTVNDLCVGTVEALKATVKGGTGTLIAKLVDAGSIASAAAVTSGIYTATPKVLEVVSATTDNLKTIKFVFNQEVDDKTVDVDNFSTEKKIFKTVSLMDDKKTVLAVVDKAVDQPKQSDSFDVTVKNVKSTAGVTITEVIKKVTFVDTTIPAITGVTVKNPKTLVITASEPMNYVYDVNQSLGEIKVDGATKIGTSTVDYAKNTITVIFTDSMATGTRKVEISGMKDYANYTAVAQSYNVEVVEDKTAPSIVSAKIKTTNEIEVTFNEELNDKGSFDIDGKDAKDSKLSDDKLKVTLTLDSDLGIGATVQIKVTYQDQTDVMGNKVSSATDYIFKVSDDTVLPTVTGAIDKDNKITLTFSKSMNTKAGTIKILNADDSDAQLAKYDVEDRTFKDDTDYSVMEISKADAGLTEKSATNIKVVLEDMKDGTVRKNDLAKATIALKSYDAKIPTTISNYTVSSGLAAGDQYVTFFFSEPMNTDTLKNLSNYLIKTNGVAVNTYTYDYTSLTAAHDVSVKEVASDAKSIKIKIKGIEAAMVAPNQPTFKVMGVKDADGNMADTKDNIAVKSASMELKVATVEATAQDTVKVTFNYQVGSIGVNTFYVRTSSDDKIKSTFKSVSLNSDLTVATFKTNDKIGTTTASLELYLNDYSATKDVFGDKLDDAVLVGAQQTIVDKIAPEVTKIAEGTTPGSIYVTFSEPVSIAQGTYSNVIQALFNDMIIRDNDGKKLTEANFTTPSSIKFYNGTATVFVDDLGSVDGTTVFDRIVIDQLTANKVFSVEFIGNTAVGDTATPANKLAPYAKTSITTKQP